MPYKTFYVFFTVFAVIFIASLAVNLLTTRLVYLAPVIGLGGMVWSLLRLRGITHVMGLRIGRNDSH